VFNFASRSIEVYSRTCSSDDNRSSPEIGLQPGRSHPDGASGIYFWRPHFLGCVCGKAAKDLGLKCKTLWYPGARIFREGSCNSIPVEECMRQRQTGLNSMLNLMEGEAEFTPAARWLSKPKTYIPRGKYRDQSGSVFA
jgi:hypothetical protein